MDILVVEDDAKMAGSLCTGLREAGFETECAGTVSDARRILREFACQLVILDLGLPDGDGSELIAELRGRCDRLPIIVTTARGELADRVLGLEAGADDYLVKPYAFTELLARIRVQLRHAKHETALSYRTGDLEIDLKARTARRGDAPIELTPREFDLLAYLVEHEGQTVSRETLASDVWKISSRFTSMNNVIDVHISRLRDKVDKGRSPRLLHTVRGVGFVVRSDQ